MATVSHKHPEMIYGLRKSLINCWSWCSFDNLYFVVPFALIVSLVVGVAFFVVVNGWDVEVSYQFAVAVLYGNMYSVPSQISAFAQRCTLVYYLWGTTLLAGAVAVLADTLVATSASMAVKSKRAGKRWKDFFGWKEHRIKYFSGIAVIVWLAIGIVYGRWYMDMTLEEAILFSINSMAASGGSPPPCTGGDEYTCHVDNATALFYGTYVLFGVPILTSAFGQFAVMLVERSVKKREQMMMSRPLSSREFHFAIALHNNSIYYDENHHEDDDDEDEEEDEDDDDDEEDESQAKNSSATSTPNKKNNGRNCGGSMKRNSSTSSDLHVQFQLAEDEEAPEGNGNKEEEPVVVETIHQQRKRAETLYKNGRKLDLGDFIVMELLRLRRVELADLMYIKELFDAIDENGDGVVDIENLTEKGKLQNKKRSSLSLGGKYGSTLPSQPKTPFDLGIDINVGDSEDFGASDGGGRMSRSSSSAKSPYGRPNRQFSYSVMSKDNDGDIELREESEYERDVENSHDADMTEDFYRSRSATSAEPHQVVLEDLASMYNRLVIPLTRADSNCSTTPTSSEEERENDPLFSRSVTAPFPAPGFNTINVRNKRSNTCPEPYKGLNPSCRSKIGDGNDSEYPPTEKSLLIGAPVPPPVGKSPSCSNL